MSDKKVLIERMAIGVVESMNHDDLENFVKKELIGYFGSLSEGDFAQIKEDLENQILF